MSAQNQAAGNSDTAITLQCSPGEAAVLATAFVSGHEATVH